VKLSGKFCGAGRQRPWPALAAILSLLLAGCATRIDWAGRIGRYTFDQAVMEMGPPDKYVKLENGTAVSEWLTSRGGVYVYPPYGYTPYPYWTPYYPSYAQWPDHYIRLTFGPDGQLEAWKKVTH